MATDDPTIERWLPIPGWEGLYDVSSLGRVRSHYRGGRILRPWPDADGYLRVSLSRGGVQTIYRVHRLVLLAFAGPGEPGEEVRHLNGDATDNRADNLAWGTPAENKRDQVRHGTHRNARKEECPRGHVLQEPNIVPSEARRGWRNCLACHRAANNVRRHPELDMRETADRHYRTLGFDPEA